MYKTVQPPWRAMEKRPPLVAGATTFPPLKRGHYGYSALCRMILRVSVERFILPPE